jgi:Nickel responsive protein SCO4226-like
MKYFIDTHDKTKGSFPQGVLTEQEFLDQFDALEAAAVQFRVGAHAAHINLEEGKAFCLMSGPNEEAIWQAHATVNLPYDSITEVKRVTGAAARFSQSHTVFLSICTIRPVARMAFPSAKARTAVSKRAGSLSKP